MKTLLHFVLLWCFFAIVLDVPVDRAGLDSGVTCFLLWLWAEATRYD